MTITIETLAIGSKDGPLVFIVTRRFGTHLDIEQAPDDCTTADEVRFWAAAWFKVKPELIKYSPLQIVSLESEDVPMCPVCNTTVRNHPGCEPCAQPHDVVVQSFCRWCQAMPCECGKEVF